MPQRQIGDKIEKTLELTEHEITCAIMFYIQAKIPNAISSEFYDPDDISLKLFNGSVESNDSWTTGKITWLDKV